MKLDTYDPLTERRPYVLEHGSPHQIAMAVCEQDPQWPSVATGRGESSPCDAARGVTADRSRRHLRSDLHSITSNAVRKSQSAAMAAQQCSEAAVRWRRGPVRAVTAGPSVALRSRRRRAEAGRSLLFYDELNTPWQRALANPSRTLGQRGIFLTLAGAHAVGTAAQVADSQASNGRHRTEFRSSRLELLGATVRQQDAARGYTGKARK